MIRTTASHCAPAPSAARTKNDVVKMAAKYAAMGRIHFAHLRNVAVLENGFEERAHLSSCGSLDMYAIVKALHDNGFTGYVRPDHGRMIWGEPEDRATDSMTVRLEQPISTDYLRLWRRLQRKNKYQKK